MSSNTMSISRMVLSTWASESGGEVHRVVARRLHRQRTFMLDLVQHERPHRSQRQHEHQGCQKSCLAFKLHPVASYAKFLFSKLTDER